MENTNDFYNILELDKTKPITKDEIKKNYKRLVIKYHPDKNSDKDTTDQFKLIQIAYETLIDDDKRKQYDRMDVKQKIEFYDEIMNLISKKYPNFKEYVNYFVETFYENSEDNFKKDLETFNFNKLIDNIFSNIPNFIHNSIENYKKESINKITAKNLKKYVIDINIYGKINVNIKDRYLNKYLKLNINRETKEDIEILVPTYLNRYVLEGEGEIGINNINGDIIIDITEINSTKFINLENDENNLYLEYEIPLYNYLYGGEINLKHVDDSIIKINIDSLLSNNIIRIKNKGMIKDIIKNYDDGEEDNEIIRADLIVIFKILNLDNENFKRKIKLF